MREPRIIRLEDIIPPITQQELRDAAAQISYAVNRACGILNGMPTVLYPTPHPGPNWR